MVHFVSGDRFTPDLPVQTCSNMHNHSFSFYIILLHFMWIEIWTLMSRQNTKVQSFAPQITAMLIITINNKTYQNNQDDHLIADLITDQTSDLDLTTLP